MIASEGIRRDQAIGVDNPAQLSYAFFFRHSIPCKIVGMANKLPGILTYSSYNTLARNSPVYISTTQMKKLIDIESELYDVNFGNVTNLTVDGVRKKQFLLKYQDDASTELRQMIYFAMNNYLGNLNCFTIQIDDVIDISEKVKKVIGYIFLVLGIIALILSFFLIWTSFYSNIRENIAEYGIMRSIGVTKAQSTRIYLYEAATIILTSIIIGTFIGIIISTSLILQFDIFIELPFIFNFPFQFYFILIIVGLFLGLLGSYYPTYAVNTLSLVKIMKGFNE
jgi:ABC-type antimicrobial peptide transport system permease subunit